MPILIPPNMKTGTDKPGNAYNKELLCFDVVLSRLTKFTLSKVSYLFCIRAATSMRPIASNIPGNIPAIQSLRIDICPERPSISNTLDGGIKAPIRPAQEIRPAKYPLG